MPIEMAAEKKDTIHSNPNQSSNSRSPPGPRGPLGPASSLRVIAPPGVKSYPDGVTPSSEL
ncbi:Avl9 protein [Aspergillus luchuensis]|uniref:Avl9 protein n=1 Tax=Aspergillus kawachii TaxID=1069201 RepID=A0A146FAV0_ASPKA|nr:Avl9 protein [Aspergillus luchuensis]